MVPFLIEQATKRNARRSLEFLNVFRAQDPKKLQSRLRRIAQDPEEVQGMEFQEGLAQLASLTGNQRMAKKILMRDRVVKKFLSKEKANA